MKRLFLSVVLLACLSPIANAEIEKLANVCESGVCFNWWPKLSVIEGWHQDKEQSFSMLANAQAPSGFTFSNAETVIYAIALYKPREPDLKTLQQLIDNDINKFKTDYKGVDIKEVKSIDSSDGKLFKSLIFIPSESGNWEQVSYAEEDDFYLIFTISSRSKKGFDNSIGVYKRFINTYKASSSLSDK